MQSSLTACKKKLLDRESKMDIESCHVVSLLHLHFLLPPIFLRNYFPSRPPGCYSHRDRLENDDEDVLQYMSIIIANSLHFYPQFEMMIKMIVIKTFIASELYPWRISSDFLVIGTPGSILQYKLVCLFHHHLVTFIITVLWGEN